MRRIFRKLIAGTNTSRITTNRRHDKPNRLRLSVLYMEDRVVPTTFHVTNTSDGPVAAAGDLPGSLRQAIFDANNSPNVGGPDVIDFMGFPAGSNTITLTNGSLVPTEAVTINGPGKTLLTIDGNNATNLFYFNYAAVDVGALTDMTLTKGVVTGTGVGAGVGATNANLTLMNLTISNCTGADGSVAIYTNDTSGTLTATNVDIANIVNHPSPGAGFFTEAAGAVYFTTETATFTGCTFSNCTTSGVSGMGNGAAGAMSVLGSASVTFTGGSISGCTADGPGGALGNFGATASLTVNSSVISGNNSAFRGGVADAAYGFGGTLSFGDDTITGNSATNGSSVLDLGASGTGTVNFTRCTISSNSTGGVGAILEVFSSKCPVNIDQCTFSGNSAAAGPVMTVETNAAATQTISITDSTLSGNTSSGVGGALVLYTLVSGSANNPKLTMRNTTITGNSSAGNGGGIWMSGNISNSVFGYQGTAKITNDTIVNNTAAGSGGGLHIQGNAAGTVSIVSDIIYGDKAGGSFTSNTADINSTLASAVNVSYSLVGKIPSPLNYTNGGNNQTGNPNLTALGSFGGPTKTMLPQAGISLNVINLGKDTTPSLGTDQRGTGFPRVFAGGTDIGATEANNPAPFTTGFTATNITMAGLTPESFTISFDDTNANLSVPSFGPVGGPSNGTVTVTGPGGFSSGAIFDSYAQDPTPGSHKGTATFHVNPPAGGWAFSNNGTYTVTVNPTGVVAKITDTLSVPAATVSPGTFKVAIGTTLLVDLTGDAGASSGPFSGDLRYVIGLANSPAFAGADTINYDNSPGGMFATPQTIMMSSQISISDSVTIHGPTQLLTLDMTGAAAGNRLFSIGGNLTVSMDHFTMQGGVMTGGNFSGYEGGAIVVGGGGGTGTLALDHITFNNNAAHLDGGAISSTNTNLTLSNDTFTMNTVETGSSGPGGAVSATGGNLTITNSSFTGNTAAGSAGAVLATNASTVTITNSTFTNNLATGAGFVGGGVVINGATTTNITGSTFTGNEVTDTVTGGAGGGLAVIGNATVTVNSSVFSNNKVDFGGGGAIWVRSDSMTLASVTINNSTLDSNTATGASSVTPGGGGIWVGGNSTVTVNNSTISNNSTDQSGGGIFMGSDSVALSGLLVVSDSTLSGNTAGLDGGGIYLLSMTKANIVRNSTVAFNTSGGATAGGGGIAIDGVTAGGSLTLSSSIVGKNTNALAADVGASAATSVGGNNNLIGAADVGNITYTGAGNLTGTAAMPLDPLLGALALNGAPAGTPFTHALLAGSPAIDAGNNTAGLMSDERGFSRVGGSSADIGAFEVQSPPVVTNLKIGDGTVQRSMITQLVVTFSEPVTFSGSITNAVTLNRNTAPVGPTGLVNLITMLSGNTLTITFASSGPNPVNGEGGAGNLSIPDGRYTLNIDLTQVTGNQSGLQGVGMYTLASAAAPNAPTNIFRLFGDVTGDGAVSAADFNGTGPLGTPPNIVGFRQAFGGSDPRLDFNGDGSVAASDFIQFRLRFGGTVP
jgi:predicted outer membrane repeat protein